MINAVVPSRYAPGFTPLAYDVSPGDWSPVICHPRQFGGRRFWVVEPYPASRADGTDGQALTEGSYVTVLPRTAYRLYPMPGTDLMATGGEFRPDGVYAALASTQNELMVAWCIAHAIATAMNNDTVHRAGLRWQDIEVLMAADRGVLVGDSRFAGTIKELAWQQTGNRRGYRVPARQARRLRETLGLIEAGSEQPRQPSRTGRLAGAGAPWVQTTYRLSPAGVDLLTTILTQYDGPTRCRVCGCTDEQSCPRGCMWVPDPLMGDLCSACPADPTAAR